MKKLQLFGAVLFVTFMVTMVMVLFVDLPVWMTNPDILLGIGFTGVVCMLTGIYFEDRSL